MDKKGGGYTTPPLEMGVWKNVPNMLKDAVDGNGFTNPILKSAEGKGAVIEAAKWMGLATVGRDPNDFAPLATALTVGQFYVDLKAMAGVDRMGRKVLKSRLLAERNLGRQAWSVDHPNDLTVTKYGLILLADKGWNSLKPVRDRYSDKQRGSWVLRASEKDKAGLPEPVRSRLSEIEKEHASISDELQRDAAAQMDQSEYYRQADQTVQGNYSKKDIVAYIKGRGGIDATSVEGTGTFIGDQQQFGGAVKAPKKSTEVAN